MHWRPCVNTRRQIRGPLECHRDAQYSFALPDAAARRMQSQEMVANCAIMDLLWPELSVDLPLGALGLSPLLSFTMSSSRISSFSVRKSRAEQFKAHPKYTIMDWARNDAGLDERDLEHVFKYFPRESTVVEMLGGSRVSPLEPPHERCHAAWD
jgi:hypothetical protein